MKFIKMFLALDFFACAFLGIAQYINTSEITNLFASAFCSACAFLLFRSARNKKAAKALTKQVPPAPEPPKNISPSSEENSAEILSTEETGNINSASAAKQLETAQNRLKDSLEQLNRAVSSGNIVKVTVQHGNTSAPVPVSGISYIEDDKTISRTDGNEITDDEIPYLMQIGYETALEKNGGYNGEVLDISFIEEKDTNKKEYTKIPTYEDLSTIQHCESYVSLVEVSFLNYINGFPLKNPIIAQKWYYEYNLNYTKTIINLISNGLLTVEHACIDKLKSDELKAILKKFNYPTNGKKNELQARIYENISQADIDTYFNNAKYFSVTPKGKELIKSKNLNL